jgi:hypothetical protein
MPSFVNCLVVGLQPFFQAVFHQKSVSALVNRFRDKVPVAYGLKVHRIAVFGAVHQNAPQVPFNRVIQIGIIDVLTVQNFRADRSGFESFQRKGSVIASGQFKVHLYILGLGNRFRYDYYTKLF